ncbi:hypothetical protein B0T19DRAFT_405346 [Cercophora scortea]|uniref:Uncharacterized protein n=1 Tax=Cercophora scortea TaxID=314031 RepID=A0AAE0I3U8_9PEZI|nr:hypothetical protein B0T19DRAFT_405346 [Cercophora scortea]
MPRNGHLPTEIRLLIIEALIDGNPNSRGDLFSLISASPPDLQCFLGSRIPLLCRLADGQVVDLLGGPLAFWSSCQIAWRLCGLTRGGEGTKQSRCRNCQRFTKPEEDNDPNQFHHLGEGPCVDWEAHPDAIAAVIRFCATIKAASKFPKHGSGPSSDELWDSDTVIVNLSIRSQANVEYAQDPSEGFYMYNLHGIDRDQKKLEDLAIYELCWIKWLRDNPKDAFSDILKEPWRTDLRNPELTALVNQRTPKPAYWPSLGHTACCIPVPLYRELLRDLLKEIYLSSENQVVLLDYMRSQGLVFWNRLAGMSASERLESMKNRLYSSRSTGREGSPTAKYHLVYASATIRVKYTADAVPVHFAPNPQQWYHPPLLYDTVPGYN